MAAALPVAGSIVGGMISSSGAKSAAKTQAAGQQAAINAQLQMFNQTQKNLQPYMQSGGWANSALAQLMGLGPNGGHDQGAYTNALNNWKAAGGQAGTSGTGSKILKGNDWQSPHGFQDIVLDNGQSIPKSWLMQQPGFKLQNGIPWYNGKRIDLSDGSTIPSELIPGGASFGAGGSGNGMPQLEDFPMAGKGPLDSPLLKPITMDQATLEKTPGYQFNLKQGLKATQNAAAARGLGSSGAALRGAATFATGLADSTYQNQFQNAVTNQQNQYNRLFDVTNMGANAAAGLGGIGQKTGENLASTYTSGANAQAGSQIAGMNALGSGFQGAGNWAGLYGNGGGNSFGSFGAGMNSLFNGTGYGTGSDVYNSVWNPNNSSFF